MGNACLSMYVYVYIVVTSDYILFLLIQTMYVGMGCNLPAGDRRFGRRCSSQVRGQYLERSKRYIELYTLHTYMHTHCTCTLHMYIHIYQEIKDG